MHTFDTPWVDQKHVCVAGFSRNILCILKNVPTVVGITCKRHGCECEIHERLVSINWRISTKYCCGVGGRCKSM